MYFLDKGNVFLIQRLVKSDKPRIVAFGIIGRIVRRGGGKRSFSGRCLDVVSGEDQRLLPHVRHLFWRDNDAAFIQNVQLRSTKIVGLPSSACF
jgi:hypothetical protein